MDSCKTTFKEQIWKTLIDSLTEVSIVQNQSMYVFWDWDGKKKREENNSSSTSNICQVL
jgi:hypothetical protein